MRVSNAVRDEPIREAENELDPICDPAYSSLPVFVSPSVRVTQVPQCGKGMVAHKRIETGEVIITERTITPFKEVANDAVGIVLAIAEDAELLERLYEETLPMAPDQQITGTSSPS